jgi:hypothetical protein
MIFLGKTDLIHHLFPTSVGAYPSDWGEVNLDQIAKNLGYVMPDIEKATNPFLDPETCGRWLWFVHKVMNVKYSFGGYLEDRATLWRGCYMQPGHTVHLGVDFNVPEGTTVHLPNDAELVYVNHSNDQNGGWGGQLIFKCRSGYAVFGHMTNILSNLQRYVAGTQIGIVAGTDRNGGWYPHLHVQCMRNFNPDVDGYDKLYDGIEKEYQSPFRFDW